MTYLRPNFKKLLQPGLRNMSLRSKSKKAPIFKVKRKSLRFK